MLRGGRRRHCADPCYSFISAPVFYSNKKDTIMENKNIKKQEEKVRDDYMLEMFGYNRYICDKLKETRKKVGRSQESIARAMGIHQSQYCRLENNCKRWKVDDLLLLCRILERSIRHFLPKDAWNPRSKDRKRQGAKRNVKKAKV